MKKGLADVLYVFYVQNKNKEAIVFNIYEVQHYADAIACEALKSHPNPRDALMHVAGEAVVLWSQVQRQRAGGFERYGVVPKRQGHSDYISLLIALSDIQPCRLASKCAAPTQAYVNVLADSRLSIKGVSRAERSL